MSRQRTESQGSMGPDDEVMPYSDDETDDELGFSSEGEAEVPPGAPHPPVEVKTSGESLKITFLKLYFELTIFWKIPFVSHLSQNRIGGWISALFLCVLYRDGSRMHLA